MGLNSSACCRMKRGRIMTSIQTSAWFQANRKWHLSQRSLLGGVPGVIIVVRQGQISGVLLLQVGRGFGGTAPVALQEGAHLTHPLQTHQLISPSSLFCCAFILL